jgi:hypothetical protein
VVVAVVDGEVKVAVGVEEGLTTSRSTAAVVVVGVEEAMVPIGAQTKADQQPRKARPPQLMPCKSLVHDPQVLG